MCMLGLVRKLVRCAVCLCMRSGRQSWSQSVLTLLSGFACLDHLCLDPAHFERTRLECGWGVRCVQGCVRTRRTTGASMGVLLNTPTQTYIAFPVSSVQKSVCNGHSLSVHFLSGHSVAHCLTGHSMSRCLLSRLGGCDSRVVRTGAHRLRARIVRGNLTTCPQALCASSGTRHLPCSHRQF